MKMNMLEGLTAHDARIAYATARAVLHRIDADIGARFLAAEAEKDAALDACGDESRDVAWCEGRGAELATLSAVLVAIAHDCGLSVDAIRTDTPARTVARELARTAGGYSTLATSASVIDVRDTDPAPANDCTDEGGAR